MLRENWPTFCITVNKYFLPLQPNLFVSLKAIQLYIPKNLEAVYHPVSEIRNYNGRHKAFLHKYTWMLWQNYTM